MNNMKKKISIQQPTKDANNKNKLKGREKRRDKLEIIEIICFYF